MGVLGGTGGNPPVLNTQVTHEIAPQDTRGALIDQERSTMEEDFYMTQEEAYEYSREYFKHPYHRNPMVDEPDDSGAFPVRRMGKHWNRSSYQRRRQLMTAGAFRPRPKKVKRRSILDEALELDIEVILGKEY